jgi:hypothetical protein
VSEPDPILNPFRDEKPAMKPPDFKAPYIAYWASGFIALALLSIVFLGPYSFRAPGVAETFIAYMFGASVGLSMTAGFWSAMGPGRFIYRVPLSLLWTIAIPLAWAVNSAIHDNGPPWQFVIVIGALCGSTWLGPQLALWCLRFMGRLSVSLPGEIRTASENQVGIRQLLVFTTLIAVMLGIARIAFSFMTKEDMPPDNEAFIALGFIVVSSALLMIPLALSMLLQRFAFLFVVVVLLLGSLATYFELDILNLVVKSAGGPDKWFFIGLNTFTAVWILIFTGIARFTGYRLVRSA